MDAKMYSKMPTEFFVRLWMANYNENLDFRVVLHASDATAVEYLINVATQACLYCYCITLVPANPPPSADSRRVVVSYKRKYVHEVLVNRLVKHAQEMVLLGDLTSRHDHCLWGFCVLS